MSATSEVLFDRQEAPDASTRIDRAMTSLAESFDSYTALNLESCIHCGMCAEACHFYIATGDPKYTPVSKIEPLKHAYQREAGPFAFLYKMLRLAKPLRVAELEQWQELLYDSCNLCGRCTLICPMGIDIAGLIEHTRRAAFDAGLAPEALYEKAEQQARTGKLRADHGPYHERAQEIAREHGLEIPVDLDEADVMLCVSQLELDRYPAQVAALIRVMNHIGDRYTLSSSAAIAENYGYLAGSRERQLTISERVIAAAEACGAQTVVVPECGHGYTALRWEAAELRDDIVPFDVQHISEYLADQYKAGRLRLRAYNGDGPTITFHDPCQLSRKGGGKHAPRVLIEALGLELKELYNHGGHTFCCGGGGGVLNIERANALRCKSVEPKLKEIDETGADTLVMSCAGCQVSFEDAAEYHHWTKDMRSLLGMVAERLEGIER